MKKLGSQGRLIAVGVLAVVLALGVAACGSTSEEQANAGQGVRPGNAAQMPAGDMAVKDRPAEGQFEERRQDMIERREARAERQEALVENLRAGMSPEDQALYDQLKASVEEQRAQLLAARQDLADTLKEMRALVDKYLDLKDADTD